MNSNMVLNPGEVILVMSAGCAGKTVSGTRVFTDVHEFMDWFKKNHVIKSHHDHLEVGDVIHEDRYSRRTVKQKGFIIQAWGTTCYIANADGNPKLIKMKLDMFGLPEFKIKTTKVK